MPVPPLISTPPGAAPSGDDSFERAEIPNVIVAIESILRQPRRVAWQLRQPGAGRLVGRLLLVAFAASLVYGFVAGTFSGGVQLWAAPIKIAGGLMISALICLPSLYIFMCLSGSPARLIEVCGHLGGLLAMMTILLIGFAPITWVFSQSTESVAGMGALHLIFWAIATLFGLRFLESGFFNSNSGSRVGFRTWVVIFLVVMLQMSTALRPIIGKSDRFLPKEKQFFAAHWADCLGMDEPQKNSP